MEKLYPHYTLLDPKSSAIWAKHMEEQEKSLRKGCEYEPSKEVEELKHYLKKQMTERLAQYPTDA